MKSAAIKTQNLGVSRKRLRLERPTGGVAVDIEKALPMRPDVLCHVFQHTVFDPFLQNHASIDGKLYLDCVAEIRLACTTENSTSIWPRNIVSRSCHGTPCLDRVTKSLPCAMEKSSKGKTSPSHRDSGAKSPQRDRRPSTAPHGAGPDPSSAKK